MRRFIELLQSQQGGQAIKSAVGIGFFIVFVLVSIFLNSPTLPLSYQIAFGQSGGSGGGGGGGGGGGPGQAYGGSQGAVINQGGTNQLGIPVVSLTSTLNSIIVTWTLAINASGFYVNHSLDNNNFVRLAGPIFYPRTDFTHKKLNNGSIHYYTVEAYNAFGTATSPIASIRVGDTASIALQQPTAPTIDRSALIAAIRQQIANLLAQVLDLLKKAPQLASPAVQQQLSKISGTTTPTPVAAVGLVNYALEEGNDNDGVKKLQICLNSIGYPVAESGSGSPGNESTYFGAKTKAAAGKFQTDKGIVSGADDPNYGYVGPATRKALKAAGC